MAETAARHALRFILNGEDISLADVRPDETLLDFLRLRRALTGTKEGCAEGDCGACTVLVGRLSNGELTYESVNACIRFLGSLHATHVVTVEHLKPRDGTLHPVQQAMVDFHGSQCGFCTPGFVMSLYGLWMRSPTPSDREIEKALQGNLCRCTGYEAIVRAARAISDYGNAPADPLVTERRTVAARLAALSDGHRIEIGEGRHRLMIPSSVDDFAEILEAEPNATIVAGSTDVGLWVTKSMRDIAPAVFIAGLDELRTIRVAENHIGIGAAVSYTEAFATLSEHVPELGPLIDRIGGEQVRNMGTIGGNIANGSPIGDTPPPLIALGSRLVLRRGAARRTLALEDFFIAYGKQDRQPGEFVEAVDVPLPAKDERFAVYKITKRRDEDITATLGAFRLKLSAAGTVEAIRIAFGGMAVTPKRATAVETALVGKPWNEATVEAALPAFETDFIPLTDMRATAVYRMLVAKNLLRRFHLETTDGQPVQVSRQAAA